jgi:hypothetical protein
MCRYTVSRRLMRLDGDMRRHGGALVPGDRRGLVLEGKGLRANTNWQRLVEARKKDGTHELSFSTRAT